MKRSFTVMISYRGNSQTNGSNVETGTLNEDRGVGNGTRVRADSLAETRWRRMHAFVSRRTGRGLGVLKREHGQLVEDDRASI